ncbi:MAG: ABC transporter substrate-binding protein [Clostridiales bacterium]|jgi:putative aldouronate transport system substrate-binding protein|nr:ABC transporter substrate-binding protein [Clostridiales bacterium]
MGKYAKYAKHAKRLLIALAAAMLLQLAACATAGGGARQQAPASGGAAESAGTAESAGAAGTAETAETAGTAGTVQDAGGPAGEGGELEFVSVKMVLPADPQKDQDMVQAEWNKYLKERLNCELTIEALPWDSQRDKLTAMLAAGEAMDLVFTAGWNGYYSDVAKGAFIPLDGLVELYGQDMKALIDPLYLQGSRIKGELYMIPTNKEIAEGHCMWFVAELVEKYNMELAPDMTIEDFEPLYRTIKENEPNVSPMTSELDFYGVTKEIAANNDKFGEIPGFDYLMVEYGTGEIVCKYGLDWYVKKYDIYRDYYNKGYFSRDMQDKKLTQEDALKARTLFSLTGMNKPGEAELIQQANNLSAPPIKVAALPPKTDTYSTVGAGLAIASQSKAPERAMMAINLLWSDQKLIDLIQSGIEGVHYVKDPGERWHKNLPEGVANPSDTGYNPGYFWLFGNDMQNLIWDNEPADKHEQYQKFNADAYKSPILGFYFDPENVKTETTAISNVIETYREILIYGMAEPAETLEQVMGKLDASGIGRVIEEAKKQYDEWKAQA